MTVRMEWRRRTSNYRLAATVRVLSGANRFRISRGQQVAAAEIGSVRIAHTT